MNDNNNSLQTTADMATMTIAGQTRLHQNANPLQKMVASSDTRAAVASASAPSPAVDDLTLTTELHLSSAELDEINQSAELQCLLQEHTDTTTFGNASGYCLTNFDSILCWPRTPRATLAALPCLDEFQGIQYDSSRK